MFQNLTPQNALLFYFLHTHVHVGLYLILSLHTHTHTAEVCVQVSSHFSCVCCLSAVWFLCKFLPIVPIVSGRVIQSKCEYVHVLGFFLSTSGMIDSFVLTGHLGGYHLNKAINKSAQMFILVPGVKVIFSYNIVNSIYVQILGNKGLVGM